MHMGFKTRFTIPYKCTMSKVYMNAKFTIKGFPYSCNLFTLTNGISRNKCSFYKIPVCFYGSMDTLGHAVGREDRACVAVTDRGLAESIERLFEDLGKGGCDGNENQ